MTCSNVIDCLRSTGVELTVTARSSVNSVGPEYTIIYSEHNNYCSADIGVKEWVLIDFKKVISFHSYQFRSGTSSNWLSEWNISVSLDNINWVIADSPPIQYAGNKIFNLSKAVNAKYVKIDGRAPLYSSTSTRLCFYYIKFYGSIDPIPTIKTYNKLMTCEWKSTRVIVNLMRMITLLSYS
jgi:hypothetical protein